MYTIFLIRVSLFKYELLEEGKRYREYLRQQLEDEKRREKEIDQIIDAEVEKQFQKRLAQWKAEKEARKKLLEDVLRERKEQVEYKSNYHSKTLAIYKFLFFIFKYEEMKKGRKNWKKRR